MVSRGKFDKSAGKKARKKEAAGEVAPVSDEPVSEGDVTRAGAAKPPRRQRFRRGAPSPDARVEASLISEAVDETAGETAGEIGEPQPQDPESLAADAAVEAAAESMIPLPAEELRAALEAVLFSLAEPVTIRTLADLFGVSVHDVRAAVEDLRQSYIDTERAFRLEDIAGGVQILTLSRFDAWIRRFRRKEREGRLSAAALETLAVIAYKQPINKADLESIRGVACGPILKTLLDRGLVQIVGREETLGKPLLYGTTRRFLETFGLHSVRDLPQPDLEARREAELALQSPPPDSGGAEETPDSSETATDAAEDGAADEGAGGRRRPGEPGRGGRPRDGRRAGRRRGLRRRRGRRGRGRGRRARLSGRSRRRPAR